MKNSSKNNEFPLLKSKFCNSTQLCQTYTKMIFELYIIQWYKADMAKHGEYGLFRPSKFEKNGKMEKWKKLVPGFEPGTFGMLNQRLTNELSR